MTVMTLLHPLVVGNLGVFSLNIFNINESPTLHLREWSTTASAEVIKLLEGIRFVLVTTTE